MISNLVLKPSICFFIYSVLLFCSCFSLLKSSTIIQILLFNIDITPLWFILCFFLALLNEGLILDLYILFQLFKPSILIEKFRRSAQVYAFKVYRLDQIERAWHKLQIQILFHFKEWNLWIKARLANFFLFIATVEGLWWNDAHIWYSALVTLLRYLFVELKVFLAVKLLFLRWWRHWNSRKWNCSHWHKTTLTIFVGLQAGDSRYSTVGFLYIFTRWWWHRVFRFVILLLIIDWSGWWNHIKLLRRY